MIRRSRGSSTSAAEDLLIGFSRAGMNLICTTFLSTTHSFSNCHFLSNTKNRYSTKTIHCSSLSLSLFLSLSIYIYISLFPHSPLNIKFYTSEKWTERSLHSDHAMGKMSCVEVSRSNSFTTVPIVIPSLTLSR